MFQTAPEQPRHVIPLRAENGEGPQTSEFVSLRSFYERFVLPEIEYEQSPRSLSSDRTALNQWERFTRNPDIRDATREDLLQLRDGMQKNGAGNNRINAVWRELKAIFEFGTGEWITAPPAIGRRMRSRLVKETRKMQRDTITTDECNRLWKACTRATYPATGSTPAPKLFRVALVILWYYGPRPSDVFSLTWDDVDYSKRLIQFEANKTSKLQGLPLTDLVAEHLKSIEGRTRKLFPGFNSRGCWLQKNRRGEPVEKWKAGYMATWHRDILPTARIRPNQGPPEAIAAAERDGFAPTITFKNFRETMLTELNDIKDGVGNWVAAHYEAGVSRRFYDLPTKRVRDAVADREEHQLPESFRQIQN